MCNSMQARLTGKLVALRVLKKFHMDYDVTNHCIIWIYSKRDAHAPVRQVTQVSVPLSSAWVAICDEVNDTPM